MRVLHALAAHDVQCSGRDEVLVGPYQTLAPREVKPIRFGHVQESAVFDRWHDNGGVLETS